MAQAAATTSKVLTADPEDHGVMMALFGLPVRQVATLMFVLRFVFA
jgi:hypothetical protein